MIERVNDQCQPRNGTMAPLRPITQQGKQNKSETLEGDKHIMVQSDQAMTRGGNNIQQ